MAGQRNMARRVGVVSRWRGRRCHRTVGVGRAAAMAYAGSFDLTKEASTQSIEGFRHWCQKQTSITSDQCKAARQGEGDFSGGPRPSRSLELMQMMPMREDGIALGNSVAINKAITSDQQVEVMCSSGDGSRLADEVLLTCLSAMTEGDIGKDDRFTG